MDEFGVLTESYGLKPQGKSAPMAASKGTNNPISAQTGSFSSNSVYSSNSSYNSNLRNGSFVHDHGELFSNSKPQTFGGLGDGFDIFDGIQRNSKQASRNSNGSSFNYDSLLSTSNYSSTKSSFDDVFGGMYSTSYNSNDDIFGSLASNPRQNAQHGSVGFDDLIPGFGSSTTSRKSSENTGTTKGTYTPAEDPFVVLESNSTSSNSIFTDPLGGISNLNVPKSNKSTGSTVASPLLRPPPKPGQVLKAGKGSDASSIDELEDFATGRVPNKADGHTREEGERQNVKSRKFKDAEYAARQSQNKSVDDLESFFGMSFRSNSVPKSRATPLDPLFDTKVKGKPDVAQKKSSAASSNMKKASSATNIADDLSSIFGAAPFGGFQEVDGESEERRKARMGRHHRTQHRVAQAVADMNQREFQTQHEQEERRRIADQMDAEIKRWAAGKEGNMRALLSSLQYVLWSECGWEPVSLTDLITSTSVKKVYRKATLCVHPDKVQQKGATLEQKYTAEKVFDILKEAWNKFNKEELS
ncbi:hypothetical protein K2173_022993 [Erythroxylum novogranatense]|uniref:J domain-containing protein n=1 Tax=Erythroxylum novogranatense TaxID=1862640 RepID=A0AAV8T984_9ROSI|nr:hypothetical protein K2173_022993 [Erythroxylum novogranatense]